VELLSLVAETYINGLLFLPLRLEASNTSELSATRK
jgi:hypothetical protein